MASRALYESGYLQAAAAIAIILVAIDLKKINYLNLHPVITGIIKSEGDR